LKVWGDVRLWMVVKSWWFDVRLWLARGYSELARADDGRPRPHDPCQGRVEHKKRTPHLGIKPERGVLSLTPT